MGQITKFLFGILSIVVALMAIGIGYLKLNSSYRQKLFASITNKLSNLDETEGANLRCSKLLQHSNVKGHVLEIGVGTGVNFICLHNNTNIEKYTGIEPNTHMHKYFFDYIQRWNISYPIRISSSSATNMHEIESNSIDTIIMTFVLCSIPDPLVEKVLLEAHRVLKPAGKFYIFEHTLADVATYPFINSFQKGIEPIWAIIFDGCRFKPMINYFEDMKSIYSTVSYEHVRLPVPVIFIKDAIMGMLIK